MLLDPLTQNNTQSETLSVKYAIFTCFHLIIFDVCSCDNFMCGHSILFHQVTKRNHMPYIIYCLRPVHTMRFVSHNSFVLLY